MDWRASSMERLLQCSGSAKLTEGLGDRDDQYNTQGDLCHRVAWQCLQGKDLAEVGKNLPRELYETVEFYLDTVASVFDALDVAPDQQFIERRFRSESRPLRGTLDCGAMIQGKYEAVGLILDFKAGEGEVVQAKGNPQLLTYASLLREFSQPLPLATVYHLIVIQPRREPKIKQWRVDDEILDDFDRQIEEAQTKDELHAGHWCRWCPAMPICPQVDATIWDVANYIPDGELTDERLSRWAELWKMRPIVNKFYRELPKLMLGAMRKGMAIPGYKVVNTLKDREWDAAQSVAITKELYKYGISMLAEPKMKSPAQVEKELRDKQLKTAFADLEKFIVREERGQSIVPEDDNRKGVDFGDPLEGFQDIIIED